MEVILMWNSLSAFVNMRRLQELQQWDFPNLAQHVIQVRTLSG